MTKPRIIISVEWTAYKQSGKFYTSGKESLVVEGLVNNFHEAIGQAYIESVEDAILDLEIVSKLHNQGMHIVVTGEMCVPFMLVGKVQPEESK